jgi:hypothetical protein
MKKPEPMAPKKKVAEPKMISSKMPKSINSAPQMKAKMQMKSDAVNLGLSPNSKQREQMLVEKFSKPPMERAFKKNPISVEARYFKKKENVMREMVDKKPKQTLVQKMASKVSKRK